jgi:hypothetical protein
MHNRNALKIRKIATVEGLIFITHQISGALQRGRSRVERNVLEEL